MLNMIAQTQLQSGYPYLMFKDNAKQSTCEFKYWAN